MDGSVVLHVDDEDVFRPSPLNDNREYKKKNGETGCVAKRNIVTLPHCQQLHLDKLAAHGCLFSCILWISGSHPLYSLILEASAHQDTPSCHCCFHTPTPAAWRQFRLGVVRPTPLCVPSAEVVAGRLQALFSVAC